MKKKILEYAKSHETFVPSFDIIFIGNRAVVSIKHHGEETNVGHVDVYYGPFFWLRLGRGVYKCFKNEV